MTEVFNQKQILKYTQKSNKILEKRMEDYTLQEPILKSLHKDVNQSPKKQNNKLKRIYKKHYPKECDKQDNILAKHLKKIPKLIKHDLQYTGPMQIQQKLLRTDYIEQDISYGTWRNNLRKINKYQLPFKRYQSLIYERADYKYINKLAHHNPQFAMLNKRLASINGGHTAKLPGKFFDRNLEYNPKENMKFVRTEQAYINEYHKSLFKNVTGKTILKHHLNSLVRGKVDKKKTYKLSVWKLSKAESDLENPKQIFTYAKSISNIDTSKALTALTKSAKITPALNYTVQANVINHHLLPKRVVTDTLQANGLKHQAKIVRDKAPNWLQRQKDGVIETPQKDVVKDVVHRSWIQYQGIAGFMNHYENMNNVLQQAGINPPSDKTKSSNKKHISQNTSHVTNKHHRQIKQVTKLTPKQQQAMRNNIER